jgi:hypothetical protein
MVREEIHEELDIGEEQVSSNECWDDDEAAEIDAPVYDDLDLGEEQVASNECFDEDEEE